MELATLQLISTWALRVSLIAGVIVLVGGFVRTVVDNEIASRFQQDNQSQLRQLHSKMDVLLPGADMVQETLDIVSEIAETGAKEEAEIRKNAIDLWKAGRPLEALELARESVRLEPYNPRGQLAIGLIYNDLYKSFASISVGGHSKTKTRYSNEWYGDAETAFENAIKFSSESQKDVYIAATQRLCMLWAGRGFDFDKPEALSYFDKAESCGNALVDEFPEDEKLKVFTQKLQGFREEYLEIDELF